MPSALAVLRLMMNSTFVDRMTGRSPGLSPRRIRAGIGADLAKGLGKIRSVAHQATGGGEFAIVVDRWHCMPDRQCGELFDSSVEESTDAEHKPACPQLGQGCESGIELAFAAGPQDPELQ